MHEDVYERLAEALDKLPNGFPRTPARTEILILKKIFSPDEASLASQLTGSMEPVEAIAQRMGLSEEESKTKLLSMQERGLLWFSEREGKHRFRLAPFIVGIYGSQLESLDHDLAHLVEKHLYEGGAAGIMKQQPALHRVVPAQKAVKLEWILPYDDIKAILSPSKSFSVRDCICRVQQDFIDRRCDFSLENMSQLCQLRRPSRPGEISKEEALALLDKA